MTSLGTGLDFQVVSGGEVGVLPAQRGSHRPGRSCHPLGRASVLLLLGPPLCPAILSLSVNGGGVGQGPSGGDLGVCGHISLTL